MLKSCYIALGSNYQREINIFLASKELVDVFDRVLFSEAIETLPIGIDSSTLFLNRVAKCYTRLSQKEITEKLKHIEKSLGRCKDNPNIVAIDLDLISYEKLILKVTDFQRDYIKEGIKEIMTKENIKFIGIIPARYASTRFPAKPLAILGGKPVIQRVYEQVSSVLNDVYVATDDSRIADVVNSFGGNVVMTSPDHKSGTDRCFEAYTKIGKEFDVVINIQGDEPFIQKSQLESLKECFMSAEQTDIATLVKPFTTSNTLAELENPNSPKVVVSPTSKALYFSRSVIPYLRNIDRQEWLSKHKFYKHIGLYAYRSEVLKEITKLPQSSLELAESLEQLRWLENGYNIRVAETGIETIGIDTPEDLQKAEDFLNKQK